MRRDLPTLFRRLLCVALCGAALCRPCCGGPADGMDAGRACCAGDGASRFRSRDSVGLAHADAPSRSASHGCCGTSAGAPASSGKEGDVPAKVPGGDHACCRAPLSAATLPPPLRSFDSPSQSPALLAEGPVAEFSPAASVARVAGEATPAARPPLGVLPARGPPSIS